MFIRLDDPNNPKYPYSLSQLRSDELQLSISSDPHNGELKSLEELNPPIFISRVLLTSRPEDTREQRAEEVMPEKDGDTWKQVWQLRDATEEEKLAWDLAHAPPPDWETFKSQAINSSTLNQILIQAYQSVPVAAGALIPSLLNAEKDNSKDFSTSWTIICSAVSVSSEVIDNFIQVATNYNLPKHFIDALNPNS